MDRMNRIECTDSTKRFSPSKFCVPLLEKNKTAKLTGMDRMNRIECTDSSKRFSPSKSCVLLLEKNKTAK
jgi:hypothetical protein